MMPQKVVMNINTASCELELERSQLNNLDPFIAKRAMVS
jgi:hypothetical protein